MADAQLGAQGRAMSVLEGRMKGGFTRVGNYAQQSASVTSKAMSSLKAAIAGVLTYKLAQQFLGISDEAKKLDAALKLATAGFGSYGQAQKDVRAIADATRSDLSDTAQTYSNFVRVSKEMGGTQKDAARATETIAKTFKISGANAVEASNSIRQLTQGLQSGVLRGDEFNSVMEQAPRFARLLAESLGVPIGSLRKLAEEGQLTSDKLLKALTDKKFTAGIDAEFRELPVTFNDAMTRVSNAAMITFSAFDRGGEFSKMLADFVTDGADGFAQLETAAENFGITTRGTLEGLGDVFDPFVQAGESALDALGIKFGNFAENFRNEIAALLGRADDLLNIGPSIANLFGANGKYDSRRRDTFLEGAKKSDAQRRLSLIMQGDPLADAGGWIGSGASTQPSSGSKKSGKTKKSPLSQEAYDREEASLNDQILRLKQDQAQDLETRANIELDRIEAARLATITDIKNDKRYTDKQKEKIIALTDTVSAMQAAQVVREREYDIAKRDYDIATNANQGAQDILRSQLDIADTRDEQLAIENRILKLRQSQERADYELLLKSTNPEDVMRGQAALARIDRKQVSEREYLNRQYESPLASYRREISNVGNNLNDQYESIAVDGLQSLNDGLTDAIMNAKGFGDMFSNVAKQVIADLIRMAIQQTVVANLMKTLGLGGGSSLSGSLTTASNNVSMLASAIKIPGFASGTNFAPGGVALVGESGPELVNLPRGSKVVPNTKLGAALKGNITQVTQVLQLDLSNAVMTPDLVNQMNNMAQSAAMGGAMAGSQDAQRTLARRSRNRIR